MTRDMDTPPPLFPEPEAPKEDVLAGMRANAPHLDRVCELHGGDLPGLEAGKAGEILSRARDEFHAALEEAPSEDRAIQAIRHYRMRTNHAVAVTDFLHINGVEDHMEWLSRTAVEVVGAVAEWICRQSPAGGKANERWFILGLGKLGSFELNYSSDIDLIVITLPELMDDAEKEAAEHIRMTRRLVSMLSKPTPDGIGWRVDLRLRPDPGATPVAIRRDAAMSYYETVARTWERSAYIRSRAIAGNIAEGEAFLETLVPFIWRSSLDFTVLEDMRVMLRREHRGEDLLGFDIKNGLGGIRSIEFFCHVQQLIAGGREPALRVRRTDDALRALATGGWIDAARAERLILAYREWRRLEHRLQMVGDAQTHLLPKSEEAMESMAALCAHPDSASFRRAVTALGDRVAGDTEELMDRIGAETGADAPSSPVVDWIQDHEKHEDAAVENLRSLGFESPENVLPVIEGWMSGRISALRTDRTRGIMLRLLPQLLARFAEHGNPDTLFNHFADLIGDLSAGAQLLSLLESNTNLATVVINVFASLPKQAETLVSHPEVLDSMMYEGFWETGHDWDGRQRHLAEALAHGRFYEDQLNILRRVQREWEFQTATHMLTGAITAEQAGEAFTSIADTVIRGIIPHVAGHMEDRFGKLDSGGIAVLALGRLGAGSMTVASDLDLIFIYDVDEDIQSEGPKSANAGVWYRRFGQQLINALTASTPEGRCYEVDMRLRPSGNAGPVAVHVDGFRQYQMEQAWLWEHMAMIKARVIGGHRHEPLVAAIEEVIGAALGKPREPDSIRSGVAEMRGRLRAAFPRPSGFEIRHMEGGLMDLDFLAQMLQLMPEAAGIRGVGLAWSAFPVLAENGLMDPEEAQALAHAGTTLNAIQQWMRITGASTYSVDGTAKPIEDESSAAPEAGPESPFGDTLPKPIQEAFGVKTPDEFEAIIAAHAATVKSSLERRLKA